MPTELVQELGFMTPGDWTPSGDARISGGALTLLDPFFKMIFGTGMYWSPEPALDPVTYDAILSLSTAHKALDGEGPPGDVILADGTFCFWAKRASNLVSGKVFSVWNRYASLGGQKIEAWILGRTGGTAAMRWLNVAGTNVTNDTDWNVDWPIGEWRQFFVTLLGARGSYQMGAKRDCGYRALDRLDAGTFAFYLDDTTQSVRIGGNSGEPGYPSEHACPWICYRRSGSCELNVASAFVAPSGTTGLTRIAAIVETDYVVDDDEPAPTTASVLSVPLRINVYHGGAWGGWADLPADGDASASPFVAGDKLLVAIDDGAGAGMDNALDPRYVPVVHKILVGHTVSGSISSTVYCLQRDAVTAGPRR